MEGYLYCGVPEAMAIGVAKRAKSARWWVRDAHPRIPRDSIRRSVADAMAMWARCGDVNAREAESEQQADFVVQVTSIDGPQGVLADCMLPGPPVQICRMDKAEMLTIQLGPNVSQGLIDADRMLRHEIGHFWGLGHHPRGTGGLMDPVYSLKIWDAQSADIEAFRELYGEPVQIPTPPTAGQPGEPYYTVMFDRQGVEVARFRRFE